MTGGYVSRKINFIDLQVGDIVADKGYKHLSVVLDREEKNGIIYHKFENAMFSTPLRDPEIKVWAHTKVAGG